MDDFFSIAEHILNTVLFCLGGAVWGRVIIDNFHDGYWEGKDWGFLILLYVLLHVIRAFLFIAVYPITNRIGPKTSWSETVFQIYGGLRGAVGIALAIALDNSLKEIKGLENGGENEEKLENEVKWVGQVYQMIGGVAFLTLILNGISAGPVLVSMFSCLYSKIARPSNFVVSVSYTRNILVLQTLLKRERRLLKRIEYTYEHCRLIHS